MMPLSPNGESRNVRTRLSSPLSPGRFVWRCSFSKLLERKLAEDFDPLRSRCPGRGHSVDNAGTVNNLAVPAGRW
jgi:hypothetical protein